MIYLSLIAMIQVGLIIRQWPWGRGEWHLNQNFMVYKSCLNYQIISNNTTVIYSAHKMAGSIIYRLSLSGIPCSFLVNMLKIPLFYLHLLF